MFQDGSVNAIPSGLCDLVSVITRFMIIVCTQSTSTKHAIRNIPHYQLHPTTSLWAIRSSQVMTTFPEYYKAGRSGPDSRAVLGVYNARVQGFRSHSMHKHPPHMHTMLASIVSLLTISRAISLPFQGAFHLSLTVLVRYRSLANI